MGCVFGKEISSSETPTGEVVVGRRRENGEDRDLVLPSGRREKVGTVNKAEGGGGGGSEGGGGSDVGEVKNGRDQKNEKRDDNARPKGERRRSRPNPRLSNPPKNVHGEQVAAGWPSWLSEVAGEAINGWIPRRADAFEKLAKASNCSPHLLVTSFRLSSCRLINILFIVISMLYCSI